MITKEHSPRLPAVSVASQVTLLLPFLSDMAAGFDGLQVTAGFDPSSSTAVGISHSASEGTVTFIFSGQEILGGTVSV